MAAAKAALRNIKAAIDANDFAKASAQANDLLKQDDQNYNALMFLGFAEEKLKHLGEAEKALQKAVHIKPEDVQPYKGLVRLYEQQGTDKIDAYHEIAIALATIFADQDNREQCQTVVNHYESFVKKHGSRDQYRRALELQLPTSSLYAALEGRVPHPAHTYQRILESSQAEEKQWVDTQIGDRRTRLGAKLDKVTAEVRSEAISKFNVEKAYQDLIDWIQDDDLRHTLDQELLQRMLDNLMSLPQEQKSFQRDRVLEKANGMVVIQQQFPLAWRIALEWVDAEDLIDWDPNILHQYIDFFPEDGLAKVLRGFLYGNTSPHPLPKSGDPDHPTEKLSERDQLIIMSEGLENSKDSVLAHRIMAHTYLLLEEHESAVDMARHAVSLYIKIEEDFAMPLQDSKDAVSLILGHSLVVYRSPRHHPEARRIFEDILSRKPQSTESLIGIGLIYEEDEDYKEAVKFLGRALERDPQNLRIRLEYAWCRALENDFQGGLGQLESILERLQDDENASSNTKSVTLYRIAYCKWHIDSDPKSRKNKEGSYRFLIASLKADSNYAPAYTLLGFYFQDYVKKKERARVAFQKAFEISTSELAAAEQLAEMFAKDTEWDLVELVAQRVVESGKAKPAPGSKRKSYSWPYAALGVVQMSRSQYSLSIVSFQQALRISPNNYHCWVGLGESYHNSGRFIAAARSFNKAETIDHGLGPEETWFAQYMLANVQRELGVFEEAVRAYEAVLETKPGELGVLLSLLQTLVDFAWARIHQGHFGHASDLATKALVTAELIATQKSDIFNLWKAVGDACSALNATKSYVDTNIVGVVGDLLRTSSQPGTFDVSQDIDQIRIEDLDEKALNITNVAMQLAKAAVLSHKRAISAAAEDVHAQAVSYYNLGWAEHDAYLTLTSTQSNKGKGSRHLLKAAIRAFKIAIELEASNAEFWNALGIVTLVLNPRVSQHSFIRSLHLNDNSARAWTNLGVLYLNNSEHELANEAFTRAQSADPEYSPAWVGQGLLAMLFGKEKEASSLFKHAFEIADSSFIASKRHYAVSAFDQLIRGQDSGNLVALVQPLFALRQLQAQLPTDLTTKHLVSLFAERVGENAVAETNLTLVCEAAEARYEESESNDTLLKYAQAKSDLARQLLAQQKYDEAVESADFVLDVTEDEIAGYENERLRSRLSAQLTLGLAHCFLKSMQVSISSIEAAVESSKALRKVGDTDPNIIVLLAQILWSSSGAQEREAARNQLFKVMEEHSSHVGAAILLSVISLLDDDEDTLEVARDDLKTLRASKKVSVVDKLKIAKALSAILLHKTAGGADADVVRSDALGSVMLAPHQPQGWLELADISEEAVGIDYVREMAVKNARKQMPPGGKLSAEDLARTYAATGKVEDSAQASMLAPWLLN